MWLNGALQFCDSCGTLRGDENVVKGHPLNKPSSKRVSSDALICDDLMSKIILYRLLLPEVITTQSPAV